MSSEACAKVVVRQEVILRAIAIHGADQKAGQMPSVCRIPSESTIHALTYGFDKLGMSYYLRLG